MTPTLFQHWILVLGGHQEVFDGDISSEVYLYPMFVAGSFHTFTKSLVIRYNHIGLLVVCLVVVIAGCFSSFGQVSSFSFLLCLLPMWGTWTLLELLIDVLLLFLTCLGWNRLFLPYDAVCPPHYALKKWGGDCPHFR